MQQVMQTYRSGTATAADTDAVAFADVPARLVILFAPGTNTSDVTIVGVSGVTPDATGVTLLAGGPPLTLWVDNLKRLGFKLGTADDAVEYLVGR